MLLNNFFEINYSEVSPDKDTAHVKIKLNKDHEIFKGHFPESPVVPGVCLIEIIKEILSEILKVDLTMKKASNIKFKNLVNPLINPLIYFDFKIKKSEDNILNVSCNLFFEETNFCSLKGEFIPLSNLR
jgi:3-hydroxyacyl-[acyl-carrier-protein] dehydratase